MSASAAPAWSSARSTAWCSTIPPRCWTRSPRIKHTAFRDAHRRVDGHEVADRLGVLFKVRSTARADTARGRLGRRRTEHGHKPHRCAGTTAAVMLLNDAVQEGRLLRL